jgi:hypothetical protein
MLQCLRLILFFALPAVFALPLAGQTEVDQSEAAEYRVYTEHPRLLLRPQRLRLLKRERERQSMRWRQFDALISGDAAMPEPGFALALYYAVSGNAAIGKKAVSWALGPGADIRQIALVYDWCLDVLSEEQNKALTAKLMKALKAPEESKRSLAQQRDRAFAAIVIAEQNQDLAETVLRTLTESWWRRSLSPKLNAGANLDPGGEVQSLFELLHAIRDNLTIDLRSDSPAYFKALPSYQVICNYPAPYPTPENEFRIPIFSGNGEPDLRRAALSRAAGLSIVAYDNNALESQFLQGWLIQDRFILKGVFGAPYEFLWANPYQPGLSYAHLPLILHDERSGALFIRSSWDEDAVWFALADGEAQLFRDGQIVVLSQKGPLAAKPEPIPIGTSSIVAFRPGFRCTAQGSAMFIIGAKPRTKYDVEVDDEELTELETDAAGTLELRFAAGNAPGVRVKESSYGSQ